MTPSGEPDECAYRTAPIVHPDPKPLYKFGDQGNKYLTPSGKPDERAYRTSPLVLAEAKAGHNKDVTPSGGPINDSNLVRCRSFDWLLLIKVFAAIQELKFRHCAPKDHQRDEDRPGLLVNCPERFTSRIKKIHGWNSKKKTIQGETSLSCTLVMDVNAERCFCALYLNSSVPNLFIPIFL